MSILYLLVFLFVVFCFINDFKKSLIIYAPFKLVFHNYICLYDLGQYITLDLAISLVVFFLYIKKYGMNFSVPNYLKIAGIIYCISSIIYGCNPRFAINLVLYEPITAVMYVFMLYKIVNNKSDLLLIINSLVVVALILCFDGVIDIVFKYNPIISIEQMAAGEHFWHSENDITRAGMDRTTSFMPHSISMGSLAALLMGTFMIIYLKFSEFRKNRMLLLSLLLLPIIIVFSNSRTPLLTFVCFLPLLFTFKVSMNTKLLMIMGGLVCLYMFFDYFVWMYNSIFNESKVEVAGSDTDLRQRQLELAIFYFLKEPIFGMGNQFQILNFENANDAAGMESVWFQLLYLQGIVGTGSYIVMLISGIRSAWVNNKQFLFFVMAWIAAITFSSQVGLSIFLFMLVILICEKSNLLNKR